MSCYGPIYTTKYIGGAERKAIKSANSLDSAGAVEGLSNEDVLLERYPSGQFKSKKQIQYRSKRKTIIEEHVYRKVDIMNLFTGPPPPAPIDSSDIEEEPEELETEPGDTSVTPLDTNQVVPDPPVVDEPEVELVDSNYTPLIKLFTDTVVETEIYDKQFRTDENIYTLRRKKQTFFEGGKKLKEKTKKRSKFRDGCEILVMKRTKIYDEKENLVYKENFNPFYWRQVRFMYDEDGKKVGKRKLKCMFKPKFRNYP